MNPAKLLLDENLSPAIALTMAREDFDVVHLRDRGLLQETDVDVFARALQLGSHPGHVRRADQLRLTRDALSLITAELLAERDLINRVLRIWSTSAYVFESLP